MTTTSRKTNLGDVSLVKNIEERATDTVGVSNEDVMTYLKEMKDDLKRHTDNQLRSLESELGKSVENCHVRISDLIDTVEKQSATLKEYEKIFESMKQKNVDLRLRVQRLEYQLDDADQYCSNHAKRQAYESSVFIVTHD